MGTRTILAASLDLRSAVTNYAITNSHLRSPFEDSFNSLEVNLLIDQLAAFHPEVCEEITDRINRWTAQEDERDEPVAVAFCGRKMYEPNWTCTRPEGHEGACA